MAKSFWPPEKVRELRERLYTLRDGEETPMNQTDFGHLLGGYIQPTISNWETTGCTSRRGCRDLERVARKYKAKKGKPVVVEV